MIVENTSQYELRSRWNRHLSQEVLDIKLDGEWCALGSLVVGRQRMGYGIITNTILPKAPTRTPCDLRLAQTFIKEGC